MATPVYASLPYNYSSAPGESSYYNPVTKQSYYNPIDDASRVQGAATEKNNNPAVPEPTTDNGPTQSDLSSEIDAIFNPQMDYLNRAESLTREQQPAIENQITDLYSTSLQSLAGEKASGTRQLEQSGQEAFTAKEDASASARRLFGELERGGIQRFGGTSSAGQAYSEINAAEHQRQQGGIQQKFQVAMTKIDGYKQDLEMKFANAMKELEVQKNGAILEAKQFFQDKLLEITRLRGEAEGNKANARLQALMDLRNQVYAINLQDLQYKQQLAANKQATDAEVEAAKQKAMQYVTGGNVASSNYLSQLNFNPESTLGINSGASPETSSYTGSIRRDEEKYLV